MPGGPGIARTSVINNAEHKTTCTISYADSRMSSLVELNSPAEYRTWLLTKVKYMAQQGTPYMVQCSMIIMPHFLIGMEDRLRSLCEDLLGPVHRSSQRGKFWQSTIMVTALGNNGCLPNQAFFFVFRR